MHLRRVFTILLFLLSGVSASGQVVAPEILIGFEGNSAFTDRTLESMLDAKNMLRYREGIDALIITSLTDFYSQAGHYFFTVDSLHTDPSIDSTEFEITVFLSEGPLIATGTIRFKGNNTFDDDRLLEEFDLTEGTRFSDAVLSADLRRLLDLYDLSGYPFATCSVEDITLHANDETAADDETAVADIVINIDEGEAFHIDEFTIEGNALTNADVIIRETRIDEGELYSSEKIEDIRRRLERLGFFSSVAEPELYISGGRGGLRISVVEGNTNLFDGIVGYQPPLNDEESGYLTGLVNLSFRNLFGTGRRLDARWEKTTQVISELELHYMEPWLFGIPLNLEGGYFQRQQDSAYVRRTFDARATFMASSDVHLAALVHSIEVIPSENAQIPGLVRSNTLSGGLELLIDTRDNVYNPQRGIFLRNSYEGGDKKFSVPGQAEVSDFIQRIELDAWWFQQFFRRHVFATGLHGRELNGDVLDVSDLYRLGGANTLRGYREEQFQGTRLGWINLEYHYSLGRRSYAFVFFDLGYIFRPESPVGAWEEFSEVRHGYGLGARIETGLGVLGVSYALGQGDSFSTGKIHFGLINEF